MGPLLYIIFLNFNLSAVFIFIVRQVLNLNCCLCVFAKQYIFYIWFSTVFCTFKIEYSIPDNGHHEFVIINED